MARRDLTDNQSDWKSRLGVGAFIFLVVVAAGVAVTGGGGQATASMQSMTYGAYSGDEAVASVPEESGQIEMSADATGEVIVIDASHGNDIDREQLSPFIETLSQNGAEVRFHSGQSGPGQGQSFNESLREADAFVTIGPQRAYSESQIKGLQAFADAGGRILVVNEPAQMQLGLIIIGPVGPPTSQSPPLTSLPSRFGISYGNGYLFNVHEYDTNYRNVYAEPTGSGQLTEGVDRLVLHESTPVTGPNTVVRTTEQTELSETRNQDEYGVVVRSGNLVALGDSSVMDQEYYQRADNEVFVGNLLDFLVSGEKRPGNAPVPSEDGEDGPPGAGR